MSELSPDLRFYWPSVSGYQPDGSLSFRFTGCEGDSRFTGHFPVAKDDPDFLLWAWIREHRHSLPDSFEERHIPALRKSFVSGSRSVITPADGVFMITAEWSGPSRRVEMLFRKALEKPGCSLPARFLETDSVEVDQTFPQLRPFLHGWGEIICFKDNRCQVFVPPRGTASEIQQFIDSVFRELSE